MNDLVLSSFSEKELESKLKICDYISKSGIIPKQLQGKPHDVYIIVQMGFELNLPPMQALTSIYVVNGSPCCSGQLMLALIYRDVPNAIVQIEKGGDAERPVVTCAMARSGSHPLHKTKWDMDKAHKRGLLTKDNWIKQPTTMLQWRAVAECARIVFPDIIKGLYTDEEKDRDLVFDENGNPVGRKTNLHSKAIETEATKKLNEDLLNRGIVKDEA